MSKIINVHIPAEQKNLTINGAYDYWQELGNGVKTYNTAATINSASNYFADMAAVAAAGSSVKNFSVQRTTDVPTSSQSGFLTFYSALMTMITGIPTLAASDYLYPHLYKMEGFEYQKVHGRTVTFGFWVKASVAGTYSFALSNGAFSRSYVTTFSINLTNTWEFKSITATLDTLNASYSFDSNVGLTYSIGTIAGSTYQTSNLNTWQSGYSVAATTGTNWIATSGATFRHTMVSMVEGSLGFGQIGFQRTGKTIQQELSMCQRYYEIVNSGVGTYMPSAGTANCTIQWKVPKRVAPTTAVGTGGTALSGINGIVTFQGGIGAGGTYVPEPVIGDARL